MNLWNTRNQALSALEDKLRSEAEILHTTFALLDESIECFQAVNTPFARVCVFTIIKARNLALGTYSLTLDGLGQEVGALLRPFIETLELLIFFRQEPARVELAIDNKLPKAGETAKSIKGEFHELRNHLNSHASHFGFTFDSLRHLIDISATDINWKLTQQHNTLVLQANMTSLFAFLLRLVIETANCLAVASILDDDLANRIEEHRDRGVQIFLTPKQ